MVVTFSSSSYDSISIRKEAILPPEQHQNGVMEPELSTSSLKLCCGQTIPVLNLRLRIFGGPNIRKIVLEFGMAMTFSF